MDIVPLAPLRCASMLWQPTAGSWTLTLVCKVTYRLAPDVSPLHEEQEPPNEEDSYWDDDTNRSLSAPGDLVPFKAHADVWLIGSAFAPGNRPVQSLVVRLRAGEVDKAIEVFGKRVWTQTGQLQEGPGFTSMPLVYERAAGGSDSWNPAGVRLDAAPDANGNVPLPNLQRPGVKLRRRGEFISPVGFGPIAPAWEIRTDLLGQHRGSFSAAAWREAPVPEDLDPAYFNAAPRDQQVEAIRNDERIELENLHPEYPRLVTNLPGVRPRVFAEKAGEAPQEVAMRCDTLWIDTGRGICALVWRGHVPLEERAQRGRVLVAMEERGQRVGWAAIARVAQMTEGHPVSISGPGSGEAPVGAKTVLLSRLGLNHAPMETMWIRSDVVQRAAMPFAAAAKGEEVSRRAAPMDDVLPFMAIPGIERVAPPAPDVPPMVAPRPMVSPPLAAPPPPLVAPPPLAAQAAIPTGKRGPKMGVWHSPGSAEAPEDHGVQGEAPFGVLAASNAAADPVVHRDASAARAQAVETPPRARPAEALELLWFDANLVARMRKHKAWKKLLAELKDSKAKARDDDGDDGIRDAEPREKRQEAKDRRDVLAVLRHGDPSGAARLAEELATAMEDGTFAPPLALVDGILDFPFDEKETLKATMALIAPFTAGDKRLKEQSDTIGELLKSPWLEKGSAGLDGHTTRLREAFAQTARGLPPRYLEAQTERLLLEQRHYQKRMLLGEEWIRALLTPAGAGASEAIPAYLPERLAKELPMFQHFRARAVVEVRLQLDQFETHSSALRIVAIGRVVAMPVRR